MNTFAVAALAPWPSLVITHIIQQTGGGFVDLTWLKTYGWAGQAATVVSLMLAVDFFYYWMHRLQHVSPWLWQEHLLHHTDEHVNVTTTGRTHILEQVVWPLFVSMPMALLLKLPPVEIVALAYIPTFWGYFVAYRRKARIWAVLVAAREPPVSPHSPLHQP